VNDAEYRLITSTKLVDGMIVKMNPFRIEEAKQYYCSLFEGEREIYHVSHDGDACSVEGSNRWNRVNLLIKGIDYE
jgi:hypothetical protein